MMAIGMKKKPISDFEKMARKRDFIESLMNIVYFFERMILLMKYAILKMLTILTIPFLVIGGIGAYNCFQMIVDAIDNSILFLHSIYFEPTWKFLGIYMIYHFAKMGLDCNIYAKK